MKYISSILIGLIVFASTVQAQPTIDSCRQEVHRLSAIEHRLFRSVIFGEPEPEQAPIAHVTFSEDGDSWIKTDDNTWESLAGDFKDEEWQDSDITNKGAIPARRGLMNTKRVTTSDLIPPMVNAVRTFDCRLRTLCKLVQESALQENSSSSTDFTIHLAGCEEQTLERIEACSPTNKNFEQINATDMLSYCTNVSKDLYDREKRLLAMTVEYDASYRSTIQFAGDFDLFVEQLRFPMENTIRQVVSVLGSLQRIPCFLSSCDDYPLPGKYDSSSSAASSTA